MTTLSILIKTFSETPLYPELRFEMSPPYRPNYSTETILKFNPKKSAVLIILYKKEGVLNTLLIKRKADLSVHSGQMSFPGGKQEKEDKNFTDTAIREAFEEVGVKPESLQILGNLTELYIPPSNFLVYPVVAFYKENPTFEIQETEVDSILEIPIDFFLNKENRNETTIHLNEKTTYEVPAYIFKENIIWGATAIMLCELANILGEINFK